MFELISVTIKLITTVVDKSVKHKKLNEKLDEVSKKLDEKSTELDQFKEKLKTTEFFLRVFAILTAFSVSTLILISYFNNKDGNGVFSKTKNELAYIYNDVVSSLSDQLQHHHEGNEGSNLSIFNHQPPDFVLSSWRDSSIYEETTKPVD